MVPSGDPLDRGSWKEEVNLLEPGTEKEVKEQSQTKPTPGDENRSGALEIGF
jgi:hypothetical protein